MSIPLANHFKLSNAQCLKTDDEMKDTSKVPYASILRCLMYDMVRTVPNLACAVSVVRKFISNPGRQHWDAVNWIFKYLRGTIDYGIMFSKQQGNPSVVGYIDAYYTGDLDDMRSTTSYEFTLVGEPICWEYKVQSLIALSTTESEYMVVVMAAKEALWLTGLVKRLGIQQGGVLQLHYDSQSVIYLVKNQMYHANSKHIDVRFHRIRELVSSSELLLEKVHTSENAADMLTKLVTTNKFKNCLNLINVFRC